MPFGPAPGREPAMGKAVAQLYRLLGRVQQFTKNRMVSGEKFRAFRESSREHGHNPNRPAPDPITACNTPGSVTLAWRERSNQADFLLSLRLLRRHIGEPIQRIEVRPGRGHNDVRIRPVP